MDEQWKVPENPVNAGVCISLKFREIWVRSETAAAQARPALPPGRTTRTKPMRSQLLLQWWAKFRDKDLAQAIHTFIANDKLRYSVWVDGLALPSLISDFRKGKYRTFPQSEEQVNLLEAKFIEVVGYAPSSDALAQMWDKVDLHLGLELSEEMTDAFQAAIKRHFDEAESVVDRLDSESELEDHQKALVKLASRIGGDPDPALQYAKRREFVR